MKKILCGFVTGMLLPLMAFPAFALNIVLTNDDGFETEYIQALFNALTNAGHNVVMSAPYTGQSGSGGKVNFLQPIFPTSEPSEGGLLPPGSPGVGPTTIADQQFYVDGSPVDAVLYGLDILSPAEFGGNPDLVISGPNEGQNLGLVTPHSGTLGATVAALNLGIPAIAVSADRTPTAGEAEIIAELTLQIVDTISGRKGIDLPAGIGLSVNIPDIDPATQTAGVFEFRQTRVGLASNIGPQFYERIGESPVAVLFGIPAGLPLPGVSVEVPYTTAGYPEDTSRKSEGNVIDDLVVTISPIQGTYAADRRVEDDVEDALESLTDPDDDDDDD